MSTTPSLRKQLIGATVGMLVALLSYKGYTFAVKPFVASLSEGKAMVAQVQQDVMPPVVSAPGEDTVVEDSATGDVAPAGPVDSATPMGNGVPPMAPLDQALPLQTAGINEQDLAAPAHAFTADAVASSHKGAPGKLPQSGIGLTGGVLLAFVGATYLRMRAHQRSQNTAA